MKKVWLIIGLVILTAIAVLSWNYLRPKSLPSPPRYLFTIQGEPDELLERPLAVTTHRGRIYVSDSTGHIQVFSERGRFIFGFPANPGGQKGSSYPTGIAIDNDGKIYVSDLKNHRILIFSSKGKYLSIFSKEVKRPLTLALVEAKIYVADGGDQKIKVFEADGKLSLEFGQRGQKAGEFSYPNGITVSRKGLIFVSDSNNKRIQVFDKRGRFVDIFGKKILALPRGVAIDHYNRVHVADTFSSRVLIFNERGKFLFSYTEPEVEGSFPQGVAIDPKSRRIYVTDRINDSVSVWAY